jgi:hypothetical protein
MWNDRRNFRQIGPHISVQIPATLLIVEKSSVKWTWHNLKCYILEGSGRGLYLNVPVGRGEQRTQHSKGIRPSS